MQPIRFKIFPLCIYLIASLLLYSCIGDDLDNLSVEFSWSPEIAIPIGTADLRMSQTYGFDTLLYNIDTLTGYPDWIDEPEIELNTSMTFDIQGILDMSEDINQIMFRINLYNGFPVAVNFQGYIEDATFNTLDSIFSDGPLILREGNVGSDGQLISRSHTREDVYFNSDRIDDLQTAENLILEVGIENSSLDTTLINYYSQYSVEIQIGVKAEIKLDSLEN